MIETDALDEGVLLLVGENEGDAVLLLETVGADDAVDEGVTDEVIDGVLAGVTVTFAITLRRVSPDTLSVMEATVTCVGNTPDNPATSKTNAFNTPSESNESEPNNTDNELVSSFRRRL